VKSKMQGLVRLAAWTAAAVLVAGCAQNPAVKFPEIQRPRTVVIEDIPELRAMAEVGFEISQPFTEASDRFFVLRGQSPALLPTGDYVAQSTQMTVQQIATAPVPMSPGTGAAAGAAGALVGAIIQANAEATQRRAAGFNDKLIEIDPTWPQLHKEFVAQLKAALEREGVQVRVEPAEAGRAPRPRWPSALDPALKGRPENAGPADADLVIQLNPRMRMWSPGPLNNYNVQAGVIFLVYNGRTQEFHGARTAVYSAPSGAPWYASYGKMEQELALVAPALRQGLLALVPRIVSVVVPGTAPPAK